MVLKYGDKDVIVTDLVTSKILSYRQFGINDPESGGILVGKIFDWVIRLSDCSVPTKFDRRGRFNFVRSAKSAQLFVDKKFKRSKGREIYLGEWHTHPEDYPKPSVLDLSDFRKTIKDGVLNSAVLFMIIVGLKGVYVGVYENRSLIREFEIEIST